MPPARHRVRRSAGPSRRVPRELRDRWACAAEPIQRGIPQPVPVAWSIAMMHQTMMGFRRDPEAVKGRRVERALVRRVLRLAGPYRKQVVGFLAAGVLGAVGTALPPLLLKSLIDTAIPDRRRGTVAPLAGGAALPAVPNALPCPPPR